MAHKGSATSTSTLLHPSAAVVPADGSAVNATLFEVRCQQELAKAKDVGGFLQRVTRFVERLGFTDFLFGRFERVDGKSKPLVIHRSIGADKGADGLFKNEFLLQYAAHNEQPIFQSAIDDYVATAPFSTNFIRRARRIRHTLNTAGYHECYNIPVSSVTGKGNVLLSVMIKDAARETVQQAAQQNAHALQVLARAIDCIGSCRFPAFFLNHRGGETVVVHARPLALLTSMAMRDLTVKEAAEVHGISVHTATKQLDAIRKALGANTNYHALYLAMQIGLIE